MNIDEVATQLLYTTVPLWVETVDNRRVTGTGFIYSIPIDGSDQRSLPFLVTNSHVVGDVKRLVCEFARRSDNKPVKGDKATVEVASSLISRNDSLDVATVLLGPVVNALEAKNTPVFFRAVAPSLIPSAEQIEKMSAIEEVTFIGYPSGVYDSVNINPVVRRGITATPMWNDFNGEPTFLIDAGVHPGSSGSPVFLYNQGSYTDGNTVVIGSRLHFLGMLGQSLVSKTTQQMLGLGVVLKAQAIHDHLSALASKMKTD